MKQRSFLHYILPGIAVLLLCSIEVSAQSSAPKLDKRMKEALAERYATDKHYAEFQRGIFNTEAWKASWIGAKILELYKSWGAPSRAFDDGAGGKVSVYEKVSNFSGGSYTPGYTITGYNVYGNAINSETVDAKDTRWASQYVETTTVYSDKDGIITKLDQKTNSSRSGY